MRAVLAIPSRQRRAEFMAAVKRSRDLHGHWAAPPGTARAFEKHLRRLDGRTHIGYWVLTETGELAAVINMNEIVRGSFQSAYLGYYSFEPHAGHGYMKAGLCAVISGAFGKHRLHRLEANIQPGNSRSRNLVKGLGFRREGFSPRYLNIAGKWRDHERWALTAEDWKIRSA